MTGSAHAERGSRTGSDLGPRAAQPRTSPIVAGSPPLPALALQRSVGNAVVASLLARAHGELAGPPEAIRLQRQESEPAGATGGSGAGAPGSGGGKPTFDHRSKVTTINASSAVEFADNIRASVGGAHCAIVLEPDVQEDWKTRPDGSEVPGTRTVVSVGLAVTTEINTVRFGMGRPDEANRAKINEMVAMMRAHEEAHRSYIVAAATAALAKAQAYVGKKNSGAAALKVLNNAECVANKQHEALDAKEGLFSVTDDAGVITISKTSSGAKYPCGKQ